MGQPKHLTNSQTTCGSEKVPMDRFVIASASRVPFILPEQTLQFFPLTIRIRNKLRQ
jgi:hypothetical protein